MCRQIDNSSYAVEETGQTKSMRTQALPQIIAVTIKNILLLSFGLTLGFPTILIPGLTDPDEPFTIDAEGLSWIGSINLICVPIGCVLSGGISQLLGRRRAMQVVNIPFVIAWLLFRFANAEWQIFMALALTGLTGGFLEAPVLTYVAEISQPHLRGMLSSTSSMAVILGVMIMFLFGTFFPWRTVALVSCIFNVLSFNLLFFVPESPHWLISKNRLLDARKSIAWLRGWTTLEDIEPEYKQIYREVRSSETLGVDNLAFDGVMNGDVKKIPAKPEKNEKTCLETLMLFTKMNFLWPYSIVCFVFVLSHFCGMTNLQTYSVAIFTSLRAPIDKYYATVILGVVELIGTIICVIVVHYTGKRLLNFVSLIGMGVCYTIVATYAYTNDLTEIILATKNSSNVIEFAHEPSAYAWIPLVFLVTFAFISHMGIRVLPWILTGELFSNETRASAAGLCSAASYIFSFTCNKLFFSSVATFTLAGTFYFNASVAFLGFIVLYFILPETEGKTLGQINEHFSGGKKMGDRVFRGYAIEEQMQLGTVNNAYINDQKIESKL